MKNLFESFRRFVNEGELTKAEKDLKNTPDSELSADDKKKKKAIQHKWMKEGRLSSDLQERYGISDEDAVGEVLWHSLNENGEIGIYDMKFGNTIIRNLLAENIENSVIKEHTLPKRDDDEDTRHGEQNEKDKERGMKKWK